MRTMAKDFRGKDGSPIRVLLSEAQFDPELAKPLRERWTMPRRRMAIQYVLEGVRQGALRSDIDPDAMIDLCMLRSITDSRWGPERCRTLMWMKSLSMP